MKIQQSFFAVVLFALMGYTFLYWWTERPVAHITETGDCVRIEVRGETRPCPPTLPMFCDIVTVVSDEEKRHKKEEEAQQKFEARAQGEDEELFPKG